MGAGASAGMQVALNASTQEDLNKVIGAISQSERNKLWAALDPVTVSPKLMCKISGEKHVSISGADSSSTVDTLPAQPVLVRGHTNIDRKNELLLKLVVDGMRTQGWAGVDVSTITIKDSSGHGGSQTYKVSADGVVPAAVALHSRSEDVANDELSDPRMDAAATVLSEHGVVPRRLAYGGNWFIEKWEGSGKPDHSTPAKAKEIGELLAKIHKIPTEWFDNWRERLVERFAVQFPEAHAAGHGLNSIPHGSHIWWFTCRQAWLQDMDPEKRAQWFKEDFFAPETMVGKRLVTSHGDLHPENMIQMEDGIKGIDLEFTHVTHAAADLGYTMNCFENRELKRAFLESYLVASGFPAEASDVNALFLDASFHGLGYHWGPLAPWRFSENGPVTLAAYKTAIQSIRSEPSSFLQSDKNFFEYADDLPEVKLARAAAEVEQNDKRWSLLAPLPAAVPQDRPIAKLARHAYETLACEAVQFTCTCWLHLHPHQRYTQQGAILSAGSRGLQKGRENGNQVGSWQVGFNQQSFFGFSVDGNTQVPKDLPSDIDLLDSQWHHVAFVYNAAEKTQTFFVDGKARRTVSYLAARPLRIPALVAAGGSPSFHVPMATYKSRAPGDKLLLVKVSGHRDQKYNGSYIQQEDMTCGSLHCGMPFFKNKHGRYLKKYNAEVGGKPDWSFDDRRPDVTKDWCNGGWYEAQAGEDLAIGTYKWEGGELTISWGELEPDKVGDADAEDAAQPPTGSKNLPCFDSFFDFPSGQLMDVSLFSKCLSSDEVARIYATELAEEKPSPSQVPPVVVEKCPLEKTLTWKEHRDKAVELGGTLPTKLDLVLGQAAAGDVDAWVPVIREDGREGDWVQIGDMHPHPIYQSHLDAHGVPGWGANNNPAHWRPEYFFVKR